MPFSLGDAVDAVDDWLDNIGDLLTGGGLQFNDAQSYPNSPQIIYENHVNAQTEQWWDSHGDYIAGHRVDVTRSDSNYYEVSLIPQNNNTEDSKTFYMPKHADGWTLSGIVFNGTIADDAAVGMHYHDILRGGSGNDILMGEGGNDTLDGGGGADRLHAGSGVDQIWTGSGADRVFGGAGNDNITLNQGDWADGNTGSDNFYFGAGATGVTVKGARAAEDDFDFSGGGVHVTAMSGFAVNAVSGGFRIDGAGSYTLKDSTGAEVKINFENSPRFYESFEDAMELRWEPISEGFIDLI